MASDIVTSVAEKIAESLLDPIWRQFQYLFSYRENIDDLKKAIVELDGKRDRVQHSVEAAKKNAKNIEQDVLNWQKGVAEVKEKANQVIEDTRNVQMTCLFCRCPNIKSRYSLSRKATKLSDEVRNLIKKGKFDIVGYSASEEQTTHLLPQDFEKFDSRRSTLKEVLETLKDSEVSLIGICGMAGVGKTKLVNEIAKRVQVEKSFDEVAIAIVSQSPDFIRIQGQLADQLGLNLEKDSILERAKRLSQRLGNDDKRILVILDDLWADLDLASLGIPIKDGQNGLKVMLTSRSKDVCDRMAQRTIEVRLLNEIEAWLLFKEISGISDDDDLKHIAEEVAKECGGLPLAIVCIGGTLKNKKVHVWKSVLRQLRKSSVTTIQGQNNLVFSRIELSYKSLEDDHYKSLLLLCCLFPEDYEIPIENLVRYAKGLEMFDEDETLNEIRDEVDTIVDHLKACYLLLSSWSDRHVKLHDVVRDVCLSIASKGEYVFMSSHAKLTEWPHIHSLEHCTAISLTFEEMNELPSRLECPRLRLLRLLCDRMLPNLFMEGMKDLRVLDLNLFMVPSPLSLQCLTSLRTLCLEDCDIGTEVSFIGCLKELEVLSFHGSILVGFPREVAQLTNLKLLDLRFREDHHHPFPLGLFSGLEKLEELYMGYYEPENEEEAKQSRNTEFKSLSHLTNLQMRTGGNDIMFQILRGLDLAKMERFDIKCFPGDDYFLSHDLYNPLGGLQRSLTLDIEARALTENSINMLLKKTEGLHLRVQGLRNFVPELDKDGFNNLKQLILASSDLEYIIDATKEFPNYALKNLEALCFSGDNLKGLCNGSIQPSWLCSLRDVEAYCCDGMRSLLPQSTSTCLVHLQNLTIKSCEMLEEVISMEENTDDKVVELSHLKSLSLRNLPKFKRLCSGNTSQALLDQVSLPALEDVWIEFINCPQQIVGCDMPNGSLHRLRNIGIFCCNGVACIAKADSLKLLQYLVQLQVWYCDDVEVIFDLEGLKSTEGLVLLPRLDYLKLHWLPKLASIWRVVPKGVQGFQNLRELNVQHCKILKYLLSPPSLAKMLVSLEELNLENCETMEEIIGGEEEVVADDNIKEFVFPKLRIISLWNLEKLRSFSSGEDHELIFPSLTELKIFKCPQLKKISYGKLSAPRLEEVAVQKEDAVPMDLKDRKISNSYY